MVKYSTKKKEAEKCAQEIISWMINHQMWADTSVYVNGYRYSCEDEKGNYHYDNTLDSVFKEENCNPEFDYCNDVNHFVSMSFEGLLYECLNNYGPLASYDYKIQEELSAICRKYGYYYELGNAWNLSLFQIF